MCTVCVARASQDQAARDFVHRGLPGNVLVCWSSRPCVCTLCMHVRRAHGRVDQRHTRKRHARPDAPSAELVRKRGAFLAYTIPPHDSHKECVRAVSSVILHIRASHLTYLPTDSLAAILCGTRSGPSPRGAQDGELYGECLQRYVASAAAADTPGTRYSESAAPLSAEAPGCGSSDVPSSVSTLGTLLDALELQGAGGPSSRASVCLGSMDGDGTSAAVAPPPAVSAVDDGAAVSTNAVELDWSTLDLI